MTLPSDLTRQVERFLKRECYGTQYGDHDRICSVCPLIALILARERMVWEEAIALFRQHVYCQLPHEGGPCDCDPQPLDHSKFEALLREHATHAKR